MAKHKCPNCGTKYDGNICPNCSAPPPGDVEKKKPWWLIILAALLLLVVLIILAAACSADTTAEDIQKPDMIQGVPVTTFPPEGTETASAAPESTGTLSIPEAEIYNAEGIRVMVTGLNDDLFGTSISITTENNSDKNVVVTTHRLSVNGYMMPVSGLYSDVAAGKKANDILTLVSSELEQSGIDTIRNVEFYLHISQEDSYETMAKSELISLKTSAFGTAEQMPEDSGELVYDSSDVRVICKGLKQDALWDGTVVFYIENNSTQPITVYAENVSVNGYMVDVSLWADLRANTKIVDGMYLMDLDSLSLNDIHGVKNLEFSLRIVNGDDWNEIDKTDPITLTFS